MKLHLATKPDEKAKEVAKRSEEILTSLGHELLATAEGAEMVLSVGGDGSLLHHIHENLGNDLIFGGINGGSLGFLSLAHSDSLEEDLAEINSISVFSFPTIAVTFQGFQGVAVQDVRIERIGHQALRLHVRNKGVTLAKRHMGDGFIITGALGSTGYNLSAGGEALSLDSEEFLLTPICPFAPGRVFDSLPEPVKIDQLDLEITAETTARLVLDNRAFEIPANTTVKINKGAESFRLLVKRGVYHEDLSQNYPTSVEQG